MADPLHTTRISDHPPFQVGDNSPATITSGSYVAPKYPSVYVGRKPLRVYIEAAENDIRKSGGVWIEARGDLISRAILVTMRVMRTKSGRDFLFNPVIGSVEMAGTDGREREVSTIAILIFPTPISEKPIDLVLAFHDDLEHSRGTKDMVKRARAANVPVQIISSKNLSVDL